MENFWNSIYLTYISLDKRIWFTILFFLSQRELQSVRNIYLKYFNGKLWPYHLLCFINSFLYDPAYKGWLFEKFIFELEAYYSFKITSILVISLKKNGDAIGKIYCLISWFPIYTPLILVSASMKMAGTSVIKIWEWTTLANSSYKGKRIR